MQPMGLCLVVLVVGACFASASAQLDSQGRLETLTASKKEGLVVKRGTYSKSDEPKEGKVDAVYCLENASGLLSHIAYHNTKTGLELEGCGTGKDWTDNASKTLRLAEGESIITVETCKAGPRSGVKVTFKTDLGQVMTCGAARKPYGYDSARKSDYSSDSDSDDERHDNEDEDDTEYEGKRSYYGRRQLLQPQVAHTSRAAKCTIHIARKQAPWSAVPNWWELDGTQPQANGAYIGLVGSGDDAYFKYEGGRYFKNKAVYQLQLEAFRESQGSFPYRPFNYYSVVYPLASFEADCSPKGLIKRVHHMHYNDKFVGKNLFDENETIVVLEVNLGEGSNGVPVPCPSVAAFTADLNTVLTNVQAASNGVIGGYRLDVYTSNDCSAGAGTGSARALLQASGNTTVVITVVFIPGAGYTANDVANFLRGYPDLCSIQSACANTSIESIDITISAAAVQQQASRRLLTQQTLKVATLHRASWNPRGHTASHAVGRRGMV